MKDAAPTVSIAWLRACLCGSNSRTYHPRHSVFHMILQKESSNGTTSPDPTTQKVGIQKITHHTEEM